MSKVFLDTNMIVYSLDQSDSHKKNKCRELLKGLALERNGVISTQVLQEFYVASTRKLGANQIPTPSFRFPVSSIRFSGVVQEIFLRSRQPESPKKHFLKSISPCFQKNSIFIACPATPCNRQGGAYMSPDLTPCCLTETERF